MNLFDDGKTICIRCNQRVQNTKIKCDSIGICTECYSKLKPVPPDSPFEGTEHIKYFFSSFFYEENIKKLIHRYKFYGQWKIAQLFSDILYNYLKDISHIKEFDFITCVPLSRKRFLNRGYNQSELIAKQLGDKLNIPYVSCVYRFKNTKVQSKLKRIYRTENTKNAFIADKEKVSNKRILLFDDIFTTGSTMNSCAGELINKGAESVIGISLAVVRNSYV